MADLVFADAADVAALLDRAKPAGPVMREPPPARLVVRPSLKVQMVISGGQTGADRAGLDAALAVGLPIGGYVPKGRKAEDGAVPDTYEGLTETGTADYGERTALNVKHSSATLLLCFDTHLTGGSAKTVKLCRQHDRPCLVVGLHPTLHPSDRKVAEVIRWLRKRQVMVLNVAGPRESKEPNLHRQALAFLTRVLGQPVDVVETSTTDADAEEATP